MAGKLAGVHWNGLDSFMAELQTLAADLVDEANVIMVEGAEAARREIAAAYPFQSGALRAGLTIIPSRGTVLAGAELRQKAPHGYIFERGTTERANKAGSNRGRMPARPTFEPIAQAHRTQAIAAVMVRLTQHGATRVTGNPEAA